MSYLHNEVDKKWQEQWKAKKAFQCENISSKPKYYALDMFPYPSGSGLHVGHMASYMPADIISRYKRAKGFNVLHPMGYDAFGLPAEQYAIQTGIHPAETTNKAIASFRNTLSSFGFSFDWSREIATCEPSYYKWTQYIFKILFEKGLAYQTEAPVNWCPALKTVLANDEVVDGKSERGGHPVVRMPMKQWMLRITDYAERLLNDLDKVDWPERTKEGQRNWIGKSEGAELKFSINNHEGKFLEVFTTRPDTLFGVTFMVLAPEHALVKTITTSEQQAKVKEYQEQTAKKSEVDRKANTVKTGVFTGAYAKHPFTGALIPIWISDYVLMDYGTGAIMAVPGHDARDFEFAKKFNLPVVRVLRANHLTLSNSTLNSTVSKSMLNGTPVTINESKPNVSSSSEKIDATSSEHANQDGEEGDLPFEGEGILVNSEFLNGLSKKEAISKMIRELENKKIGTGKVQYKLRDWLFSRQRYWGEPFPLVYGSDGVIKAVPDNELPVLLPNVADYEPSEKGEAPLARVTDWVRYNGDADVVGKSAGTTNNRDQRTGVSHSGDSRNSNGGETNAVSASGFARRETDTMPGAAGSSWYFLRYIDPHNDQQPFSFDAQKYWMPVDLYVGGAEHTVGHLLYSRFWHKVLFDVGLVSTEEPFMKLAHQGMILGPDGEKMSKSRGNTIPADSIREQYGADAVRAFICFLGPMDRDKPWDPKGIEGVRRFLDRFYRLVVNDKGEKHFQDISLPMDLEKSFHKTIKKVTEDIETMNFNTAISAMMIFVNDLYKAEIRPQQALKTLSQLLMPFAPHLAEELWQLLGGEGVVSLSSWPTYDPALVVDNVVTMAVQVLGKTRGTIEIGINADEATAVAEALKVITVKSAIGDKKIDKVIYKAGKILNLIVK